MYTGCNHTANSSVVITKFLATLAVVIASYLIVVICSSVRKGMMVSYSVLEFFGIENIEKAVFSIEEHLGEWNSDF